MYVCMYVREVCVFGVRIKPHRRTLPINPLRYLPRALAPAFLHAHRVTRVFHHLTQLCLDRHTYNTDHSTHGHTHVCLSGYRLGDLILDALAHCIPLIGHSLDVLDISDNRGTDRGLKAVLLRLAAYKGRLVC